MKLELYHILIVVPYEIVYSEVPAMPEFSIVDMPKVIKAGAGIAIFLNPSLLS